MTNFIQHITFIALLLNSVMVGSGQALPQANPIRIPGGSFHSILPEVEGESIEVKSFYMDEMAVTNSDFLEFLKVNEMWQRSNIPAVYADPGYLRHSESDRKPGKKSKPDQPVTRISWFAAKEYCQYTTTN